MSKRRAAKSIQSNPPTLPISTDTVDKKIDLAVALRLRIRDGWTHAQIAEKFGVRRESVTQAFSRWSHLTDDPKRLQSYVDNKLQVFQVVEQALVERILDECVAGRGKLGDLARSLDVVSKHVRLLMGESTANVSVLVKTLETVHGDLDGALAPPTLADVEATPA